MIILAKLIFIYSLEDLLRKIYVCILNLQVSRNYLQNGPFGLWYICRTQADDYEAVNDALNFRKEEIPCDVIGLEPGWMAKDYDLSITKSWNPDKFPIPAWSKNGPYNFIDAIKRMGFHFELWECNEYDLAYEEERRLGKNR